MIVAANGGKNEDQHGDEENGDPRALDKFCDEDDEDGDAGDEAAESIDESTLDPMRAALFAPVFDHPEL